MVRPLPHRWGRLVFGALALLVVCGQILQAERSSMNPSLGMTVRDSEIVSVDQEGNAAASGLRPRDRIVEVAGERIRPGWDAGALLRERRWGDTVALVVLRGNERVPLSLPLARPTHLEVLERLATAAAGILTLFVGILVYLKKPRRQTFIFAATCFAMGYLVRPPYLPPAPWSWHLRGAALDLLTLASAPLFVHFFLLFPQRHSWLSRQPHARTILYAPSATLFALSLVSRLSSGKVSSAAGAIVSTLAPLLLVAGLGIALVLFVHGYRHAQSEISRRKVRVALWATAAGTLPVALLLLLYQLWPDARVQGVRLAALSVVFVPLGFGYAIVRHGVLDATLIVRRSLAVSVLAALLLLAYLAAQVALRAAFGPHSTVSPVGLSFLSLLSAAALYLPARRGMRAVLGPVLVSDRAPATGAATEWSRALRGLNERAGVVRRATDLIGETLQSRCVVYFERQSDGGYEGIYAYGLPPSRLGPLVVTPSLGRQLAQREGATDWADLESDLPYGYLAPSDERLLAICAADLALPVQGSGLDDLILVGRPLIGEPYSAEDLRLAEAIATEARVALAQASLERRMLEERRLSYEMSAARELQEGLLPRDLPQIESMELAGCTLQCQAVGGDYYDCLRAPAGKLVLAVGDVSGKGVPGAILAANLQAMVRTEGLRDRPVSEIVQELNRRLCEMHRPERYVTFCLVRIDPLTGSVEFCNAGHLSPLLVTSEGNSEELSTGGMPLGIGTQAIFEEGRTTMRSGDLLVLMTDGITERRSPAPEEEEFGSERLLDLVIRQRRWSARALQRAILAAVRGFSPTPLDDDTTLLIAKML